MKVAFICGPYRAKTLSGIVDNIRRAEKYAQKYWKMGYCVICPHKNTALFDGLLPDHVWLAGAKKLMTLSDVIVAIPGYEKSSGSLDEWEEAEQLGKEIIFDREQL
jgi:hypothetical protein